MGRYARRQRAVKAAYAGGVLLVITGSTGAVAFVRMGREALAAYLPGLADMLWPLFLVLMVVAAFGGFSVVLGAYVMDRHSRFGGKVLIALGSGVGLLVFLLHIVLSLVSGGNPFATVASMAVTLQGLGVLLAVYAQAVG